MKGILPFLWCVIFVFGVQILRSITGLTQLIHVYWILFSCINFENTIKNTTTDLLGLYTRPVKKYKNRGLIVPWILKINFNNTE